MVLLRGYDQSPGTYNAELHKRVLEDISNILNTRKGFGSFDPDFGIEDMSHFTDKAMIAEFIKNEIQRNLATYYPQVEVLNIIDAPTPLLSRINMILSVRVKGEPLKIRVYNEQGFERWIVAQ